MSRQEFANALRPAIVILATLLATGGYATAADYPGAYRVEKVHVLAEGRWQEAEKKAPREFVVEFKPSWPPQLSVKVTWYPRLDSHPDNPNRCEMIPSALNRIFITRNGQPQPGHPSAFVQTAPQPSFLKPSPEDFAFYYVFANVPRSDLIVEASCKIQPGFNVSYSAQGSATIRFRPQDPLLGWNPGLTPQGTVEILTPNDGATLARIEPLKVGLRTYYRKHYLPKKLGLQVEKGLNVQTGVVGDIALPGNKPYITQWKALKIIWFDAHWYQSLLDSYVCELQLPGYLDQARVPEHQPGFYRFRILVPKDPPTPWRTVQIPAPPAFRKVR